MNYSYSEMVFLLVENKIATLDEIRLVSVFAGRSEETLDRIRRIRCDYSFDELSEMV